MIETRCPVTLENFESSIGKCYLRVRRVDSFPILDHKQSLFNWDTSGKVLVMRQPGAAITNGKDRGDDFYP